MPKKGPVHPPSPSKDEESDSYDIAMDNEFPAIRRSAPEFSSDDNDGSDFEDVDDDFEFSAEVVQLAQTPPQRARAPTVYTPERNQHARRFSAHPTRLTPRSRTARAPVSPMVNKGAQEIHRL